MIYTSLHPLSLHDALPILTPPLTDTGLDLRGGEHAALAIERPDLGAGEDGGARALEIEDVRSPVRQDFVARPAVQHDRDLIAHRARRQEDGVLLAEQLLHHVEQAIGAGVLVALLVADRRLGHGLAHSRRRPRRGIALTIE